MAYVYVRQSTLWQVNEHQESTERQYRLQERALDLGWLPTAIEVIDEDQGRSGRSATAHTGFQRLVSEVEPGPGRDRIDARSLPAGPQLQRLASLD